ncbi:hypothetical protein ACWDV4_10215 [Micromonospora sp. NPDC003197]
MRRFSVLLGLPLLMTIAACAQQAGPAPGDSLPDRGTAGFEQRASDVAAAWRTAPNRQPWQTGYVPVQDATVLPAAPKFSDDTRQAFLAGWYRQQVELPSTSPADGTINFPDGSLTVPLVSAVDAYRQIDQGDPPPCPARAATPPPTTATGPDGSVSSTPSTACIPLTVTGAQLGTVAIRTSRGEAQVPAWLFTVEELSSPVARVAVASSAVGAVPSPSVAPLQPGTDLVSAQSVAAVDGNKLTYRLGVGACDKDITPLVLERDDTVVVSGRVTRPSGVCTEQLVIHPVTVTLATPLGPRTVLDAVTGAPLLLTHS